MRQKIPEIPLSLFCIAIYWPPLSVAYIPRETALEKLVFPFLAAVNWSQSIGCGWKLRSTPISALKLQLQMCWCVSCYLPPHSSTSSPNSSSSSQSFSYFFLPSFLLTFIAKISIYKDPFSTVYDVLILMPFNLFQNFPLYLLSQIVYLEAFEYHLLFIVTI